MKQHGIWSLLQKFHLVLLKVQPEEGEEFFSILSDTRISQRIAGKLSAGEKNKKQESTVPNKNSIFVFHLIVVWKKNTSTKSEIWKILKRA